VAGCSRIVGWQWWLCQVRGGACLGAVAAAITNHRKRQGWGGGLPPRPWVIGGQGQRGWAARGGEGAGGWMTCEFESESEERGRGGR
jgi:hypothetical protein